ncbi:MAG: GNAT family N-acetyltransferase [Chloroflexi bacterium]|nr:GNAT family N-acetyltransferase [Chloroflexota bacterium]
MPFLGPIELEAAAMFAEWPTDLGLDAEALKEVDSIRTFREAQKNGHLWVAVDENDAPVGLALVHTVDMAAHLEEMDVLPLHGRKGLGAASLEAVCSWAKGNGYLAVTLSTFRDVPWNKPFYEKHGFRAVEPNDLSPALLRVVDLEHKRGLSTDLRVIMRRVL